MPIEDGSHEAITLFPCSGLGSFRDKNHIYLARAGHEKDGAIKNPTLETMTVDEARQRFKTTIFEISGSHTICADCSQRDRELNL